MFSEVLIKIQGAGKFAKTSEVEKKQTSLVKNFFRDDEEDPKQPQKLNFSIILKF